jgi:hypothetical protein
MIWQSDDNYLMSNILYSLPLIRANIYIFDAIIDIYHPIILT